MENTSSLLFDNTEEKYYLATPAKIIGPMTALDLFKRLQSGKASLLDYFWCYDFSDWKRICDSKDFATLIPKKPSSSWLKKVRETLSESKKTLKSLDLGSGNSEKPFYLYYNRTQYGPFTKEEVIKVIETQDLSQKNPIAYVWTPGLSTWKKLSEHTEFSSYVKPKSAKNTKRSLTIGAKLVTKAGVDKTEKRGTPRRPLVARIFLHNNRDVIIAVCRDISSGGMQVLTDRVPGEVGQTVKLNVSPSDSKKVQGFTAEGEIVRILEDGRGFSFRFVKISPDAKKAIDQYIDEA